MSEERLINVSVGELKELERRDVTKLHKVGERLLSFLPILIGVLHLLEFKFMPNAGVNSATNIYAGFIIFFLVILTVWFIISFFNDNFYEKLKYNAAFYIVLFIILTIYDVLTLKTATLKMPYFPWIDRIFNAMWGDRKKLLDCVYHSLILLFTGYLGGVIVGLISGVGAGWSKKISYWVWPVTKVLGAIPTTTYMPIVMMLAASMFGGSAFLIGLGVWFPVTVSSMTGVANVPHNYYEAARTLGTGKIGILFRVVIPAALPSIFGGLTQGMSVACLTLVVAEMMGVESGLGWYINWQKGWAEFAKMYGAIILICITFIIVNGVLNRLKRRVLRWQEGGVK